MKIDISDKQNQSRGIPNGSIRIALVIVLAVGIAVGAAATATAQADVADRTIEEEVLTPGSTTTITVEAGMDEPQDFNIVEEFDAFSEVEIVDDDGAFISQVPDSNDELFTTYEQRESATFVYEVTVPDDADDGAEFTIESGGESDTDAGIDTITVEEVSVSADRVITDETLEPGESTTISVDVDVDEPANVSLDESIDDRLDVTVVNDDGAESSSATNGLTAEWSNVDNVSLVYEVTVPDDADGDTYSFSGVVETDTGAEDTVQGDDSITVPADVDVGVERTIESTTLAPGESTTVTIDAGFEEPESPSIAEVFDPVFADFEVIDDGGAEFVLEGPDGDELTFAFGTVEITESTMEYEVTIPEDAESGQEFTISSDDASDYDLGSDTIEITDITASADRSIADDEVLANDTTEVTVEVETSDRTDFQVSETVEGAANVSIVETESDGDGIDVDTVDETLTADVSDATTATITYEVTVGDDADQPTIVDGHVSIDGVVFTTTGDTTITVVESPLAQYADDDGVIRLTGVLGAISDYSAGESELGTVLETIGAYGSGDPVL